MWSTLEGAIHFWTKVREKLYIFNILKCPNKYKNTLDTIMHLTKTVSELICTLSYKAWKWVHRFVHMSEGEY